MKQSIQELANEIEAFGYEEPKGFLPLRQSISTYLKSHGIKASPDSILIVSGALQALDLISVGLPLTFHADHEFKQRVVQMAADAGMGQEEFLLQAVKFYIKNLKEQ